MIKAAAMKKKIAKQGVVTGVMVVVAVGLIFGSGMLKTKAEQAKATAEGERSTNSSKLSAMQTQIQESGQAEKEFIGIAANHDSDDYSANSDVMKEWLRQAKDRYRFGDGFKLTLPLEAPSDKTELSALNYDVAVRAPVKLELDAMSDLHVYSFIGALMRQSPGLINMQKLDLTQSMALTDDAIKQMRNGLNPMLVRATLEFNWVGMKPKEKPEGETPAAAGQ